MGIGGVEVVDELDQPIGIYPIEEVWSKGLLHRIVLIMVRNEAGLYLIQRRSPHMKLYPGRWDFSAAGHVDEGESYEQAARRELQEEAGILAGPLAEIARFRSNDRAAEKKLNRFYQLYEMTVYHDVAPDGDEVAEFAWLSLPELLHRMKSRPDDFTDGFVMVIQRYYGA